MGTRIVFAGGNEVEVEEALEDVKRDIQASGAGHKLLEYHRRADALIYVNRAAIAYIEPAAVTRAEKIEAARIKLPDRPEPSEGLRGLPHFEKITEPEVCECPPGKRRFFQGRCVVCQGVEPTAPAD